MQYSVLATLHTIAVTVFELNGIYFFPISFREEKSYWIYIFRGSWNWIFFSPIKILKGTSVGRVSWRNIEDRQTISVAYVSLTHTRVYTTQTELIQKIWVTLKDTKIIGGPAVTTKGIDNE
jgi:hypothetical protein